MAAGAPPPNTHGFVKLPAFWIEDPVSWFWLAEGQFTLWNVEDSVACYCHVLSSLSQDAVCLVRHMLHEETSPNSYANLRTLLLASHSLSNYQKMERMMKLPPLGDRKPSVMLAEMLEYCPAGESITAVFTYLFLQRLPREIRVLLSEQSGGRASYRGQGRPPHRDAHAAAPRCCTRLHRTRGGRSSSYQPPSAPSSSSRRVRGGGRRRLTASRACRAV